MVSQIFENIYISKQLIVAYVCFDHKKKWSFNKKLLMLSTIRYIWFQKLKNFGIHYLNFQVIDFLYNDAK